MKKFTQYFLNKFKNSHGKNITTKIILTGLLVTPLLAIGLWSFFSQKKLTTEGIIERRGVLAHVTAIAVEERLNNLIDLGTLVANHPIMTELIKNENWQSAAEQLAPVTVRFPIIESLSLANPEGINMSSTFQDPKLIGLDLNFREAMRRVRSDWQPVLSEVVAAENLPPHFKSIFVGIPISSQDGERLGILIMQVKLNSFLDWLAGVRIGAGGFSYVTDQYGKIIANSRYDLQREIIDFSSVPAVKMMLGDVDSGVEISYNPVDKEEMVSAFEKVSKYDWGVVVTEPTTSAFADRNRQLILLGLFYITMSALGFFLASLISNIIDTMNQLRQKEETLVSSIGDGVVAIDRNWKITAWNKSAARLSGWSEKEALGKNLRDVLKFYRESDRKENIAFIEEAIVSGRTGFMQGSTILIRKDKTEITVGDSAAPIFDEYNDIVGAIIIFRDVTEEKEMRRVKSDFAYASHQLGTPINKTLWLLESLQDENDPIKIQEKTKTAYRAALSVRKLTSQLLAVSEIDQKMIVPKPEKIKLSNILEQITKTCRSMVEINDCTSVNVAPLPQDIEIETDTKLLKGALIEVIDNAVKYGKKDIPVNIKTEIKESNIIFSIENDGIGIPQDQQALTFVKFYRGTNFNTTDIPGAGIGLFVAKEYIDLLGGKIWFNSEKDRKTIFFISISIKTA